MAVRRNDLDGLPERSYGRDHGPPLYDWDSWTDGSVWELTPGEDFQVPLPSFRIQVGINAKRRDLVGRTRMTKTGTLLVQFFPRDEPDASAMTPNDLPPGVRALLDVAADAIKQAHELSRLIESGRAVSDYLTLEHQLTVYGRDLEGV